ncbi:hypothetical protein CXG81DRAFT_18706 [Caulochytrium protostelioides]|uniref:Uncharacterized protein n=1 Tax=Caulochytrium protostelioides TaxID=1555241 RepID=A0A4P9X8C1_9FUNG|nr:hypothetical protein CXG81DRAFT_18706 [Caulochytrium protostelioides]|eukprot:RKP01482.1 hypothetical protein CXG81DRAFT_18706 [Caulochytrium protostelioides]
MAQRQEALGNALGTAGLRNAAAATANNEAYKRANPGVQRHVQLKEGGYVLLRNHARKKCEPKWMGPFTVREAYTDFDAYQLVLPNGMLWPSRVHADCLRRVSIDTSDPPTDLWY